MPARQDPPGGSFVFVTGARPSATKGEGDKALMPLRASVSQAVCQNCWTWYGNGQTVCPKCRVPLMGADSGAPAFAAGGTAASSPTGAPSTSSAGGVPPPPGGV